MNILQQALEFVQRLLKPDDPARCPYCKRKLTKNGTRPVTMRDLSGVGVEQLQRRWCHLCRRSYLEPDPRREKWARYTRQVQRKGLDMYMHLGGSLQGVAEWIRAEVNPDTGRALVWDPRNQPWGRSTGQAGSYHALALAPESGAASREETRRGRVSRGSSF